MSVIVLTPNPAVDVTYRVGRHRVGDTIRVTSVTRRAGGKGINVASVLQQLGVPTVTVCPLGGAAGAWLRDDLERRGLPARPVPIAGETRTTVTVVDDHAHPTVLSEPGPPVVAAEWRAVTAALAGEARPGGFLVISGSLPPAASPALVATWVERARAGRMTTIVDVSGPALLAAADAGADLLKPNSAEILTATGLADEASAARHLRERGAGTVIVSRGASGMAAYAPTGVHAEPAPARLEKGNPTGAGDAATAGLVAALREQHPLAQALRTATVAGAAAIPVAWAGEIDLPLYSQLSRTHNPPRR